MLDSVLRRQDVPPTAGMSCRRKHPLLRSAQRHRDTRGVPGKHRLKRTIRKLPDGVSEQQVADAHNSPFYAHLLWSKSESPHASFLGFRIKP